MTKKNWLAIAVLSVVPVLASPALARFIRAIDFDELDRDSDGVVTTVEFEQSALERWAESDLNHDGKVTADELFRDGEVIFHGGQRPPLPQDADNDGAVTREEAIIGAQALARRLDADDDGRLTEEELSRGGLHILLREGEPPRP
jgi:Ca2+-binding EF-hand superfamily protein